MKSYMTYRPSQFAFMIVYSEITDEITLASDERHAKMNQKPNFESKKIRILGENGINSKF